MKFNLSGATAPELQERFVIPASAPRKKPYPAGGEHLNYFFELDNVRMGWAGLYHNPDDARITWNQFYPFCVHLTENEVRELGWVDEDFIREMGMDHLRRSQCNWSSVPDGLEKTGLGTLAHTLVVRHLYRNVIEPDRYKTSYFNEGSVKPRLVRLLERAGVGDMVRKPMCLQEVQEKLTDTARKIFSFRFER